MTFVEALAVSGFGFAVVFAVLIALSGILKVQAALFNQITEKLKGDK